MHLAGLDPGRHPCQVSRPGVPVRLYQHLAHEVGLVREDEGRRAAAEAGEHGAVRPRPPLAAPPARSSNRLPMNHWGDFPAAAATSSLL